MTNDLRDPMQHPMNGYDYMWDADEDPELSRDDDGAEEDEWVLDCGFTDCCMPGYHLRSECHSPANIEAFYNSFSGEGGQ